MARLKGVDYNVMGNAITGESSSSRDRIESSPGRGSLFCRRDSRFTIPSDERHGQHVYSYIYPAENDRFRSPINCRAGAIFIFFWRTLQNQGMSQSLLKRRLYGTG